MSAGKGIAGHGNGQPPMPVQVQVTTTVTFMGAHINIAHQPDGGRQLEIIDKGSATVYVVPLTSEVARELGSALMSVIPTAKPGDMPRPA